MELTYIWLLCNFITAIIVVNKMKPVRKATLTESVCGFMLILLGPLTLLVMTVTNSFRFLKNFVFNKKRNL